MKISQVEAVPILVPLKAGLTTKTAHGEHIDSPYVIVRVHTDEGLVGLGEATLAPRWSGETSPSCVAAIRDLLDPALRGADPRNVRSCLMQINRVLKLNPFTKAAVEMALWDVAGKAAGQPLYRLLGGKVREKLPMKMVVGAFEVPKAVALAEQFLDWGVCHLKVKVGLDPEQDIERVQAVRNLAGPEVTVGIDANCGWNITTARRMLREMEALNIAFAEQPVGVEDPNALGQLRSVSTIPIMADESVFTLADAWDLVRRDAVDILSIYPGKTGGILPAMAIASVAEAAGVVCSMGSNLEMGIATAAMLHLGATAPAIDSETYPGDFLGPLYHEADLITQPLSLGPINATVPEGPGLGVALDENQLEHWRA